MHNSKKVYPYEQTKGKRFALTWSLITGSETEGCKSFLKQGHVFYFDRYYTSVDLFYAMIGEETYGVGKKKV